MHLLNSVSVVYLNMSNAESSILFAFICCGKRVFTFIVLRVGRTCCFAFARTLTFLFATLEACSRHRQP